ncbi:MAG: hypothetical protein ABJA78_13110 [Ferruginibacter sp.]
MAENTTNDFLEYDNGNTGVPKGINVLTILTFIGCAVSVLGIFVMQWFGNLVTKVINDPASMDKMTEAKRAQILKSKEMFDLYHENRIPLLIVVLLGVALCIWGAVKMRQRKKDGFYIYVFGEIAPIIASAVIIGFSVQYSSPLSYALGMGIPLLFIILYSQQLKHMK